MSIYGDVGNVIALKQRALWRGIKVNVRQVSIAESFPRSTDVYFMGGGQDDDQIKVFEDLLDRRVRIEKDIKKGICFLGICGAYQLLGKKFITGKGKNIEGLGLLNIETKAPGEKVSERCIGNIVARVNSKLAFKNHQLNTIVGFENHSGQTYLGEGVEPLGTVIKGYGNNITDQTEGCIFENVIGTYMHGSFLPKNPHIADWLIKKALERKYRKRISLKDLNDEIELAAHRNVLEMLEVN